MHQGAELRLSLQPKPRHGRIKLATPLAGAAHEGRAGTAPSARPGRRRPLPYPGSPEAAAPPSPHPSAAPGGGCGPAPTLGRLPREKEGAKAGQAPGGSRRRDRPVSSSAGHGPAAQHRMAPRSAATAAACCRHLRRILRPPARRRRLASPRGSRSILPFPPRPCPPLPAPLRSVPAPSSAAEKRRHRREEPLAAYPPPRLRLPPPC